MAKFVIKNPVVEINSVDLSDHISEVTIETERDEVDVTAFGATHKEMLAGLGDATITMQAFMDYAAGEVYATLWPLSTTDTPFNVYVKPTNGAISATNPQFQMSSLLYKFDPFSGSIGEAATTELVFRNASQSGLVADVTP